MWFFKQRCGKEVESSEESSEERKDDGIQREGILLDHLDRILTSPSTDELKRCSLFFSLIYAI